ncbi:MAG TPA: prepilin-type N-terminal cleavage/methylation domain-containing protein [Kiritimatiellia bacterium]|nr:prepilin-type N-terminal cleavage/methylation domain-containing protein [Kiritimatiellia bacterium]
MRTFSNKKATSSRRQAGLTLIEVMLALVILTTGLVALVTAAGRCISVARQARNYEIARELLARIEVEKPAILEENVEDIAGSGSFDRPHQNFRWVRSVEQEGFEDDGLWRVETEVLWTEHQSARREKVVTLIYWPEEKKGGSFERAP